MVCSLGFEFGDLALQQRTSSESLSEPRFEVGGSVAFKSADVVNGSGLESDKFGAVVGCFLKGGNAGLGRSSYPVVDRPCLIGERYLESEGSASVKRLPKRKKEVRERHEPWLEPALA